MKKIILSFVIISVLISIVVSLNSKPTFIESPSQNTGETSHPEAAEVQKNSGKVLAVMPQEY